MGGRGHLLALRSFRTRAWGGGWGKHLLVLLFPCDSFSARSGAWGGGVVVSAVAVIAVVVVVVVVSCHTSFSLTATITRVMMAMV